MRAREDRGRRLAPELLQGDRCVLAPLELRAARLDVRRDERPVLVERGPARSSVLLERERDLRALLDLLREEAERAEAERAQDTVQRRRLHTAGYAPGGSSPLWHPGHQ